MVLFFECFALTSITIPSTVTSISIGAFTFCYALSSITVDEGNTIYDSRNNCNAIIETATNTLVAGCANTEIPSGVTGIAEEAFSGCYNLTSITIGSGVASIGNNAFSRCSNLVSVSIPEGVTSIGDYAFWGCGLTTITIPKNVTSIGVGLLSACNELTSVNVDEGNHVYDSRNNCNAIIETATNSLVAGCKRTYIPGTVTSIATEAFYYCSQLTSISIPESVTTIGDYAFRACGLTSFTFPESLTSISRGTLYNCSEMTSVILPSTVTSIYDFAFAFCYKLADVYCLAEDIPTTYSNAFIYSPISSATLHVPAASLEQYQTTAPWSGFGTIVGMTQDEIDAIEEVKASEATAETARYDIHGRQISTPQNQRSTYVKGINIIRHSNGTTRKVLVK